MAPFDSRSPRLLETVWARTVSPFRESWSRASAPLRATLLMVAAMSLFSTMGAFIRLASDQMHILEVVFFRNFFALLLFVPLILSRGLDVFRTKRIGLYGVRALLGLGAMTTGFASVIFIPLAEATALNFTAPLFATLLAVLFMGERIRFHRSAALIVGFIGVLAILQPGVGAVSFGAILAIASALLIATSLMVVKHLTRTEEPGAIALWMVTMMAPASLVPALFVWTWPSPLTIVWLVCLAAAGTCAHIAWTRAVAISEVSQIQPLEFVKLPLSALIGYFAFSEAPSIWVWIGGGAIFLGAAIITHRETVLARERAKSPPALEAPKAPAHRPAGTSPGDQARKKK